MLEMRVYVIKPGGDVYMATAITKGQAMDFALFAQRHVPGALGVSLHGAGLSGEVGFNDVAAALQYCTLPLMIDD